jgi:hypothetical protein
VVFGGSGVDRIETYGPTIHGELDADLVVGDNARATLTLGEIREVVTTANETAQGTAPSGLNGLSYDDVIHTGNGDDLVLGGNGGDTIYNRR